MSTKQSKILSAARIMYQHVDKTEKALEASVCELREFWEGKRTDVFLEDAELGEKIEEFLERH